MSWFFDTQANCEEMAGETSQRYDNITVYSSFITTQNACLYCTT